MHAPVAILVRVNCYADAIVAIEDSRFYSHHGVDWWGVARAALANFQRGSIEQGASTLTMQLARKWYLTRERSYERKIREALMARHLEKAMNKSQILEAYLNEAYFGAGAYGVSAAANRYYQKTPDQLSIAQAALLAGLVQSPSRLSPISNPRGARHRQVRVLTRMRELGYISTEQFRTALDEATTTDYSVLEPGAKDPMLKYPYFSNYVLTSMVDELGEDSVYDGGLTIRTTLDRDLQKMVQSILTDQISRFGPGYGISQGAAVLVDNKSGEIRALVGGTGWTDQDQFNRAWQAQRQPGSSIKPFLYAAALRRGYTQNSMVKDETVTYLIDNGEQKWTPRNSDRKDLGKIPLKEALRLSRNQAAVALVAKMGIGPMIQVAQQCGIESDLPRVPALALGAAEVNPLEMAQAYCTIANQGVARPLTAVSSVRNANGETLLSGKSRWTHWALAPETAATLTDMMMRVVRSGTGGRAYLPGVQVAGKTGTTDQFRDAWFVGFTPKYTLAVWMGNDDNSPTNRAYGGTLPAKTWREIMGRLDHGGHARFDFLASRPEIRIYCKESHQLAGDECEETYREQVYAPVEAQEPCEECGEGGKAGNRFQLNLSKSYPQAGELKGDKR